MHPLERILDNIREKSRNNTELGNMFANLMLKYLNVDPVQRQQLSRVWKYSDWAQQHGYSARDTGIDLVGDCSDGSGFVAIQCKCRSQNSPPATKSEMDSFLSASSKTIFSRRMFIDTTISGWGENVEETLRDQNPPVTRLNLNTLKNSADWSQYEKTGYVKSLPKKQLRPHQEKAFKDVISGFEESNCGKLIMACGTGKTLVSQRIAEKTAGKNGWVLVLMPSLALISQCVREWSNDTSTGLRSFAVCSDTQVGIQRKFDPDDPIEIERHDLEFPATTNPQKFAESIKANILNELNVVFCTYQSTQVISDAQKKFNLPVFDLIIFDEAHRTTGIVDDGEGSNFLLAHYNKNIDAKKRLYMTATPRIYGEKARSKADQEAVELCSMDNERIFGPVFHTLNFGKAVKSDLLSDFKVVIFAVDEFLVQKHVENRLADKNGLELDLATKIVGCYKAILKLSDDFNGDTEPMHRSIVFCNTIKSSKKVRDEFNLVINEYNESSDEKANSEIEFEVKHVDGRTKANDRNKLLNWLGSEEDKCKILSNARCLSEGVDVPSLDAIVFFHPRKSQIDIVQSVGRVMRKTDVKDFGYVIIPVVIPLDADPVESLNKSTLYKSIWQILNALRSHDQQIYDDINRILDDEGEVDRIEITAIIDEIRTEGSNGTSEFTNLGGGSKSNGKQKGLFESEFKEAMRVMIVKKCGDREYWKKWASENKDKAIKEITR